MRPFNLNLTDRAEENLAVGLKLNPHIENPTDLLRDALETYINMSADPDEVIKERKAYRREIAQEPAK